MSEYTIKIHLPFSLLLLESISQGVNKCVEFPLKNNLILVNQTTDIHIYPIGTTLYLDP